MKTKILSCALALTLALGVSGVTTLANGITGDTEVADSFEIVITPRLPGQHPMQDFMPETNGDRQIVFIPPPYIPEVWTGQPLPTPTPTPVPPRPV